MDFYGNFDGMIYYDIFAKLFMGPAHPGFVQASVAIRQNPDAMGEVHPCLRIILGFFLDHFCSYCCAMVNSSHPETLPGQVANVDNVARSREGFAQHPD